MVSRSSRRLLSARWSADWITDNYQWRWIFFINVPVALISMYLTNRVVEDPPHLIEAVKRARAGLVKIDYTGFLLHRARLRLPGGSARQGTGR